MKDVSKIFTVRSNKTVVPAAAVRTLHESLKWVLIVAQCFGLFPILGISNPDSRSLKFTWRSWRSAYCILNCIGAGFLAIAYIQRALWHGMDIIFFSAVAFHVYTFLTAVLFLKLATEWPRLMKKWAAVEFNMRSYGWPRHLHTRITLMSVAILSIAVVEYLIAEIKETLLAIKYKKENQGVFEYYVTISLCPSMFDYFSYATWKGILLQIMNVLLTFAWSFNDLFIMLMSTALAVRFQQVTMRLRFLNRNRKVYKANVWGEAREDYNRLSKLTRILDEALSYITLTSFSSNLFFILIQLFNSLRLKESNLEKAYFFFSFGFLILRTVCVSLYGAWIYDESKQPVAVLNSVSSEVYNVEIKRFIEQIKYDTVALTGKHFFYVTRGLILSMAGAIVTYELVLIQFSENLLQVRSSGNGSVTK